MEEQNNKDNYALKYWKTFEKLVIVLLKKKLENKDEYQVYAHETPHQNDGGFDGIIFIEPQNKLLKNIKELYTILTEAKLRKNENKDLPLSDFAKTLIIAINRSAAEVYVYTNLHYSPETYRRVNQFSIATSLKVKLIDIFGLCNELETFSEIQPDFPEEFIQQLFSALPMHNQEKKIHYVQENIFDTDLPKLAGDHRNAILEEYTEYFKMHSGVFIIEGMQGCGKTLLIKHFISLLQSEINCRLIQLEKFNTIKEFFIYLLSLIWNVDTIEIYNLTKENIDEITLYMPEQYCPERVKLVLLNILSKSSTEYENRVDVFEEHLIEYLYYIFIPICQRKKQLFAFANFDKSTENIINFTNKFIRKFSTENIIILAELRIDISHSQALIDEWTSLNPNKKPIELSEFSRTEYVQYMMDNYPDRDLEFVDNLFSICYPLPLYIDNVISIVDDNHLEKLFLKKDLNIKKLYNNDKFKRELIIYSVSKYFRDKNEFCKKLAYIITFFDGELSMENIEKLGSYYFDAATILANSIYFDLERNYLRIHHILYLKAFQEETLLRECDYYCAMKLLYDIIDNIDMEVHPREIKKLEIAIALKENDYVLHYWEKICNDLIIQNDFSIAKKLLEKIYENDLINIEKKLKLLNYIIKCYLGLNEYNSSDLLCYIKLGEMFEQYSTPLEWRLFCYLKAKYYFSLGEYQKIIALTDSYRNIDPQIRYIRALSIKHMYGINCCLLSFERGIKHFSEDWHLKYSYLDHLHSKYEKINYDKSWEFLIQIEQYYDELNLEDQIHFQYNKIALELYKTQVPNIDACQELYCKTFENVLPVEMGRIHNLLGQIYYFKDDIDSAIKEFETSFSTLKRNMHVTYIFVPLINLALSYNENNDSQNCIQYAIKVIRLLEKYKKGKIENQLENFNENIIIEKECAAFIISMELIEKKEQKIFLQFKDKFPQYNSRAHSSSRLPQYYRLGNKFTFRC